MAAPHQALDSPINTEFTASLLDKVGSLSLDLAEIAGTTQDMAVFVGHQEKLFGNLRDMTESLRRGIGEIDAAGRETASIAGNASSQSAASLKAGTSAVGEIRRLVDAVQVIEQSLGSLKSSLSGVRGLSANIQTIASQTNLLALNAAIEAARAGEAGKGFAVVASEVKHLAGQANAATSGINNTVTALANNVGQLISTSTSTVNIAGGVNQGLGVILGALENFHTAMSTIESKVSAIASSVSASMDLCQNVLGNIHPFFEGVKKTGDNLRRAEERVSQALERGEHIMNLAVSAGVRTADSPFIDAVSKAAKQVAESFEQAVDRRRISLDDLFDDQYQPIAGTTPQQFMTRFTELTDSLLPPIQEPMLKFDPRVVFCVAVDRNGYLPTHNRKFSQPQGADPVWNSAHCRNRRIFNDRTGLRAGQNTKPFLLQTYRRDMGGGNFVLMKDLSVPVRVHGRHWGGLRLAYRVE